jgi:hypothetical protein
MQKAMPIELPATMRKALAAMASAGSANAPEGPPQDLKDYDPEDSGTLMGAVSDLQFRHDRQGHPVGVRLTRSGHGDLAL